MAEAGIRSYDIPTSSLEDLELSDDNPSCTVEELERIITAPAGGFTLLPTRHMDEVYTGVYMGDASSALDRTTLQNLGIKYVLNTAKGPSDTYHVNTNEIVYKTVGIDYYTIEATDQMNFNISKYFDQTSDYIERALAKKAKILVHCREGCSRSATIILAFLMIKRHMRARDAVRYVRITREICPNEGFLQQLCDLNEKLIQEGHFDVHETGPKEGKTT